MKKFEYKEVDFIPDEIESINIHGEQGWELVTVFEYKWREDYIKSKEIMLFKRELST